MVEGIVEIKRHEMAKNDNFSTTVGFFFEILKTKN